MSARQQQLATTIAAALVAGAWATFLRVQHPDAPSDLTPVLLGAEAFLAGENPYVAVDRSPRWAGGLLYPFTAVTALLPFAWMPDLVINVAWVAISAGWLAWMLSKDGITPRLVMLMSPAMIHAVHTSQWTPILTAAALSRWGGWLLACKPTTAVWLLTWAPRLRHVLSAAVLIVVSLLLWPRWPIAWQAALDRAIYTVWPLALPLAPLVLAALLRWRDPGARLLVAMALVPHTTQIYETLPLFLIATTWVDAGVLWTGSVLVTAVHSAMGPYPNATEWTRASGRLIVWLVYLPALVIVLRPLWTQNRRDTPRGY